MSRLKVAYMGMPRFPLQILRFPFDDGAIDIDTANAIIKELELDIVIVATVDKYINSFEPENIRMKKFITESLQAEMSCLLRQDVFFNTREDIIEWIDTLCYELIKNDFKNVTIYM